MYNVHTIALAAERQYIFSMYIILIIFSCKSYSCTAVNKYSTEETISKSDLIVLATVVDYKKAKDADDMTSILFEIDEVLYGSIKANYILIDGKIVVKSLGNKHKVPYVKGRRRNSGGECFAYDYEYGSSYLLILKNGTPYWTAYSPVNEKITNNSDPWLMWVKGFIAAKKVLSK